MGNSPKNNNTYKGKCEAVEHEKYQLQKKLLALQKEVDKMKSLQKYVEVHVIPSSLAARNGELQSSSEAENKFCEEATINAATLTSCTNEVVKVLQKEKES